MWDKISDYTLDVSKYLLTAMFITSLMTDLGEARWLLYTISGVGGGLLFCAGLYFDSKSRSQKREKDKRRKQRMFNNKKKST